MPLFRYPNYSHTSEFGFVAAASALATTALCQDRSLSVSTVSTHLNSYVIDVSIRPLALQIATSYAGRVHGTMELSSAPARDSRRSERQNYEG